MINAFNLIGAPAEPLAKPVSNREDTTKTSLPTEPHGKVDVNVLNASSVDGLAHLTAAALQEQGFHVTEIGNATTLAPGSNSEILYGPAGFGAALTLDSVLSGPVTYVPDSSLSGQTLSLLTAGRQLTVHGPSSSTDAATTASTAPTTTTTTTVPPDVYTNTQPEPWNPYPCTLGAPNQASRTSTTVKSTTKKKG
jgi:hypothetical protein